jgi:spore coat polysaccharide biosynthesis predicted glycosyltransferase SpsG
VTLLADAGEGAGLGHVSRCTALAVALRSHGFEVAAYAPRLEDGYLLDGVAWGRPEAAVLEPGRWMVLDSYRPLGVDLSDAVRLVWFEDEPGAAPPFAATITVSSVRESGPEGRWLYGERYACLRPSYWDLPERATSERVGRVLVTTGSGDPLASGPVTAAVVARVLPKASVALVAGPFTERADVPAGVEVITGIPSLLPELLQAHLAVTAGGQTMLEALAVGVPCVALPIAANQRAQAERLRDAGAVRLAEPSPDAQVLERVVAELAGDADARAALASRGRAEVDGHGALRVADEISRLRDGQSARSPG